MATLSFLKYSANGVVYLIGDDVLLGDDPDDANKVRKVSSLVASAKAHACRLRRTQRVIPSSPSSVRSITDLVNEHQFVHNELIPHLQKLAGDKAGKAPAGCSLAQKREDLAHRVRMGSNSHDQTPGSTVTATHVTEWFQTPRAILGRMYVPLERIESTTACGFHVSIYGNCYRFQFERAERLEDSLMRVSQLADRHALREAMDQNPPGRVANAVVDSGLGRIEELHKCSGARCEVIYRDPLHQVVERDGMHFLIRDQQSTPRSARINLLGIQIYGNTREMLLSMPPIWINGSDPIFISTGTMESSGICMGKREQYASLRSNSFTNAEALVLWLDAAVSIVGGERAARESSSRRGTRRSCTSRRVNSGTG